MTYISYFNVILIFIKNFFGVKIFLWEIFESVFLRIQRPPLSFGIKISPINSFQSFIMSKTRKSAAAPQQPTAGLVQANQAILCKKEGEVTGVLLTTQVRIKAQFEIVNGKVYFTPFASLDEQFVKDDNAQVAFFGKKELGDERFESFLEAIQYLL